MTQSQAEAVARGFNESHPVGVKVRYWTMLREGEGKESKTRSEAFVTNSGEPAVFIAGQSGYVTLSHVEPIAS